MWDKPDPSDYTGQQVFYRSLQQRERDVLTVHDYLWRWDTDWFWCSRAFGAQQPVVRRLWPRSKLRSDVYWKIVAFENRHHVMARLDARRGRPARERVVQDVEIPLGPHGRVPRLVPPRGARSNRSGCARSSCAPGLGESPTTTTRRGTPWPLYPMAPGQPYVNVGFWSTVAIEPGHEDGDVNRAIEDEVGRLGGHKSLYSDAYYDEPTFDRLYGGAEYRPVKKRYDPRGPSSHPLRQGGAQTMTTLLGKTNMDRAARRLTVGGAFSRVFGPTALRAVRRVRRLGRPGRSTRRCGSCCAASAGSTTC